MRRWVVCMLIICGSFTVARPALAQNRVVLAKKHYLLAEGYYKLGKFTKALAEYEKALSYKRYPALLFNIAQCHRFLDRHKKALFFFKLYLVENPRAPNRRKVFGIIRKVQKKLTAAERLRLATERNKGRLTLVTEPKGAEVRIDKLSGKAQTVTPAVIHVKAGQHLVVLSLKGYRTVHRTVTVPPRGVALVKITLEPLIKLRRREVRPGPPKVRRVAPRRVVPPPVRVRPPVKPRWKSKIIRTSPFYKRWWFWTGLLAGGGLILGGSYFGLEALQEVENWERTYDDEHKRAGERNAGFADLMFATGGAILLGVIIGTAVVGMGKTYEKPVRTTFVPSCNATGCGLWVRGSF